MRLLEIIYLLFQTNAVHLKTMIWKDVYHDKKKQRNLLPEVNFGNKPFCRGVIFGLTLICISLFLLYQPTFYNPPRSDYWSAFYIFFQVETSPDPHAWSEILTFDLWNHGTYRPLSHLVPYLEYKIFAPNFLWNHVLNLAGYCLSIVLLYVLSCGLRFDKVLTLMFLAVFAFLFSHFDILGWTFQLFSILGFCCQLLGFILYQRYLRSKMGRLLIPAGIFFLLGMLCSEAYAAWPLGVIFLGYIVTAEKRPPRLGMVMLAGIYLLYLAGFILNRASPVSTGPTPPLDPEFILSSFFLACFNLFYTGIVVNLWPFLVMPLYYNDNMNMGGVLLKLGSELEPVVLWVGLGVSICLGLGLWLLIREKKRKEIILLTFFLFLYLSNWMVVGVGRLTTNDIFYPLSQFRYQYVSNALLVMMAIVFFSCIFRIKRTGKIVLIVVLAGVLVVNILASHRGIVELNGRVETLKAIMINIRDGLESGRISRERPLFIDIDAVNKLPSPSWNRGMAQFMEGSLEWFFPPERQGSFTRNHSQAYWELRLAPVPEIKEVR